MHIRWERRSLGAGALRIVELDGDPGRSRLIPRTVSRTPLFPPISNQRNTTKIIGAVSQAAAVATMDNCTYAMETGPLQINYLEFHYCIMGGHPWISFAILCTWLLLLFYLVGHTADTYFSPTLSMICTQLAIPFDVAGVTLLAFGNGATGLETTLLNGVHLVGAPDVFSSLATSTSGAMDTGLNALLGGVMFVTTVVVGAVLQSSPTSTVKITPRPFCRDVLALLVTLAILFVDLPSSASPRTSAGLLLSCYALYVVLVIVPSWFKAAPSTTPSDPYAHGVLFAFWHAPELFPSKTKYGFVTLPTFDADAGLSSSSSTAPPLLHVDESYFPAPPSPALSAPLLTSPTADDAKDAASPPHRRRPRTSTMLHYVLLDSIRDATIPMVLVSAWSRRHATLSLLVTPLFVGWIVAGDAFSLDAACVCLVASLPLASAVYWTTYQTTAPTSAWICALFYTLGFVSCVCWIYGLASELVAVLSTLGILTTLPASVLGLTVLSWGNSLGDLSTNVAIAKGGCAEMALAGCFGGPVFNLLVGLGVPFLFVHATTGHLPWDVHGLVSLAALGLSLSLTLAVVLVYRFSCPRWYGRVLFAIYAVYTLVHVLIVCRGG
ncbi:Aste57867_18584 [Aphanomyces stellatus]|uniref:Aste57867_18584 protein n=1 Tax=Aphanomyces stellatus TaxID=120398 RepID=A0A485LAH5_9STRA|nr:hypothetical protein As57867_018522 [Aphanomyces stellatus]VFT95319.1 Aste57867_18584 [Aphanomyces stellatus]